MGPDPQMDQDWEAFRYIAGEMTADEAEAFEAKLLTEQSLREAVAAAVELTESIALLRDEVAVEPQRRSWSSIQWKAAACAVAAGLVLAAALWPLRIRQPLAEPSSESADANVALDGLAESWTALRQAQRRQAEFQPDGQPSASETALEVWDDAEVEIAELESFSDEHADAGLPAWLIAAAELDALSSQEPQN